MEQQHEHQLEATANEQLAEVRPEVWIGTARTAPDSVIYGAWLDAARPTEDLHAAVEDVLTSVPAAETSGWTVYHYRGFAGAPLDKCASLDVITEIARGVATHGEPFAQWAAYVGCHDREALRQFEDCYLGCFETLRDYIGYVVRETAAQRRVDELPPALRHYALYTVRVLARSWARRVHVAPASSGGFNLFAPPC